MKIQQSAEDYLETILMLSYRKPMIRSIDVVNELGYSKPSVSVAMKNLRENGYISMDHEGYITLEPSGRKIAEMIYERHTLLTKLLVALDVPREVAVEDACRIEHVISRRVLRQSKNLQPRIWQRSRKQTGQMSRKIDGCLRFGQLYSHHKFIIAEDTEERPHA